MFATLQEQLISYWKQQSQAKKITLAALLLAVIILAPILVNWANTPSYSVAYTGLSEADAAQIVQKLDENNILYQLKNSGTIEVPTDDVYTTRFSWRAKACPNRARLVMNSLAELPCWA